MIVKLATFWWCRVRSRGRFQTRSRPHPTLSPQGFRGIQPLSQGPVLLEQENVGRIPGGDWILSAGHGERSEWCARLCRFSGYLGKREGQKQRPNHREHRGTEG